MDLGRYFQAFMWTARADLRVLSAKPTDQNVREMGTAIVLCYLLKSSGYADQWRALDKMIRLFVGRTDAMTFSDLQPLLEAAGIRSLDSIQSVDTIRDLQRRIAEKDLGAQLIVGDVYFSPCGSEQLQLPRAFVFTGQRFNPDGWVLGNVIADRILWNEDIPGFMIDGKVMRRFASALDMAYAVLGNRHTGPEIAQRMLASESRRNFRDGLPYAHNLIALARTFERIPEPAWDESIYTRWLAALRQISAPNIAADTRFPEAMRTRAWAMRLLNTQLASYTELKHDTVLYAKEPYNVPLTCEYPAGFVEPLPGLWGKMQEMAEATATNLAMLPVSGTVTVRPTESFWEPIVVNLAERQAARISFCQNFALQMRHLQALARRELYQEPFTSEESAFTTRWDGFPNRATRNWPPAPRAISRSLIPWISWPKSPSTSPTLESISSGITGGTPIRAEVNEPRPGHRPRPGQGFQVTHPRRARPGKAGPPWSSRSTKLTRFCVPNVARP